jgi:hypothetical protein
MEYLMLFSRYNYDADEEVGNYSPLVIMMQECIRKKESEKEKRKGLLIVFIKVNKIVFRNIFFLSQENNCH